MYFNELDTYKVEIKVIVKHADKRLFELFEFQNYNTIALCDGNYYFSSLAERTGPQALKTCWLYKAI